MFALFIGLTAIVNLACSQSTAMMTSSAASPTNYDAWNDLYTMPIRALTELSRVSIVLSRRDYSLIPSSSYKYIQYPSSYRATLTQAIDVVDAAFRKAEMSFSRVQMITSNIRGQVNTALDVITQGTIQDRKYFLPSALTGIARSGKDLTSIAEEVAAQLKEATAFFDELLRGVQPASSSTPASGTGSTSTSANKSPLDINHGAAISNIAASLNALTGAWNQLAQQSNKLVLLSNQAAQAVDKTTVLLGMLAEIEGVTNVLSTLASLYQGISSKVITSRTVTMASYLMLETETDRLAEVQKVNERVEHNIPLVQKKLADAMVDVEKTNKARTDQLKQLAAALSS